jgi:hypothetical protein
MVLTGRVIISGDSYVHTFQKECVSFPDLRTSGLTVGEYVTVSTDDFLAVATGPVYDITQRILTLSLNRLVLLKGSVYSSKYLECQTCTSSGVGKPAGHTCNESY